MRSSRRLWPSLLSIAVIAVPLSIVTTILLFPFWSWLEAASGIESVGHSGPAEWCYATVFLTLAGSGAALVMFMRRGRAQ